jgi:hypothetical protein
LTLQVFTDALVAKLRVWIGHKIGREGSFPLNDVLAEERLHIGFASVPVTSRHGDGHTKLGHLS